MTPLNHPYRRINHFRDYLNELQGLKPKEDFDNKLIKMIESYFENVNQLTFNDLNDFCIRKIGGLYSVFEKRGIICQRISKASPKLLHALGGPWVKYTYYENSKLILLANRFDRNSIFYRIPVDVARLLAKESLEVKKRKLGEALLKISKEEEELIINTLEKLVNSHNELSEKGDVRKNFISLRYIMQKLLDLYNINYKLPGYLTSRIKLEFNEKHFKLLMDNLNHSITDFLGKKSFGNTNTKVI
jgi:Poxvirus Late Transcription Factor VLTF3 like